MKTIRSILFLFRRLATHSWWVTLFLVVMAASASSAAPFAYVANLADGVWVIDTATRAVVATVAVGAGPQGVAITPNGAFAYVVNFTSNTVSVIDTAINSVVVRVPVGDSPYGVAIRPNGVFAYVTNSTSNTVSVIDTTTNSVVATMSVGEVPQGVVVTPDGAFVYVANFMSNNVSVIDTSTNTLEATVGVGVGPVGVAITPDGAFAYVANSISDTVSVIDTAPKTVVATVPVAVGAGPRWVAITSGDTIPPDTSLLSGPAEGSYTNSIQTTFAFAGTDDQTQPNLLAFSCSLDDAAFSACGSPQTYADLTDGRHTFAVRAVDAAGNADSSPATRAWVVDSTPPVLSVTASPRILWPPDHRMVEVILTVAARDNLGAVRVVLVSATSSEPDNGVGDGDTTNDIQSTEVGTLDTRVLLRAERSGVGPGRIYTLTYQATDLAGNTTTASVTIVVPHDGP